ncbi:MAG: hypothetical protein ACOC16_02735 [Nanoarchaeota archaeon]
MVLNKHLSNKKGQAAIEFLMTYGWMLLVVLIVGALIFSFVDFGSLLPNKVELSNNVRASATESYASVNAYGSGTNETYALVVFTYSGAQQVKIDANDTRNNIVSATDRDEGCEIVWVKNVDTDISSSNQPSPIAEIEVGHSGSNPVVFLNGQTGIAEFNCSSINGGNGLFENDVLDGRITLLVENSKTGVKTPSSGPLRLSIGQ